MAGPPASFHAVFTIFVSGPDRSTSHVIAGHTATIGSSETADVRIAGADAMHARIVIDRGVAHFEPVGHAFLGERRIEGRQELWHDHRIAIAGHRVGLVSVAPRQFEASYGAIDAAEAALVDAIIGAEEASRLVYADWLDDRGDPRARLVRELESGSKPDPDQLAQLVPTNVRWRARVLQPPIEGCRRGDTCPGHWGGLAQRAGRADLRTCMTCTKLVLYAVDPAQAREHLGHGGTVVLDALALRWPGDLRAG